jgi:hypothetical protein
MIRFLNAENESLDTVISPGFINSILSVGNTIQPKDMLLVAYANGTEFFTQSESNGVITLAPANQTVPFPFTNVQFVAVGGSDLNAGNNLNAPKATIQAALNAITAGGLVWVLDSAIYENQPIVTPIFNCSIYAPNATLIIDAVSGSLITQPDSGGNYVTFIYAAVLEAAGGANVITQNGSSTALSIYANELGGPGTFNGTTIFNISIIAANALNFTSTSSGIFNVGFCPEPSITAAVGATLYGKLGDTYYNTQIFANQIISQQQETQETVGRTLIGSDSNTTVNYMNTVTGTYVLPATGIPVGTRVTFMQLSSGLIQFNSDGTSTILSYLNASPVQTGGLNAVATAEQISAGVWMIYGNLQSTGP